MGVVTGVDAVQGDPQGCRLLGRFHVYRIWLASAILLFFYSGWANLLVGSYSPLLFSITAFVYLGFVLAGWVLYRARRYSCEQQAYLAVFIDIPAIILLMHSSGGITTGIGLLLTVSVAFGSLIMRGRAALAFASIASLALLAEQVYTHLTYTAFLITYTQAGLLGLSLFATAGSAEALARRLRESELLALRRRLDLANMAQLNAYIVRHMQSGIVVVDPAGTIRLMNQAAWSLLGMPDARNGRPLAKASDELALRLVRWEKSPGEELKPFRVTPAGHEITARFTRLGDEQRSGTLIVLDDATAITEQAQQMKLASLGRLTASIAHEIRNPLGAISHAGQLLSESPELAAADRRLTEIIDRHARRVNAIIEDVLNLSRRVQANPDRLHLGEWLPQYANEFGVGAGLGEENLSVEVSPPEIEVLVDPGQLHQILDNLCSNSVRHFHRPRAELRLRLRAGLVAGFDTPYLEVIDNGPGISEENRRQIFEPFFTTGSGGTGLGLYISKELSESNRLQLEYLANPDGGSCFRIGFPATRTAMVE